MALTKKQRDAFVRAAARCTVAKGTGYSCEAIRAEDRFLHHLYRKYLELQPDYMSATERGALNFWGAYDTVAGYHSRFERQLARSLMLLLVMEAESVNPSV